MKPKKKLGSFFVPILILAAAISLATASSWDCSAKSNNQSISQNQQSVIGNQQPVISASQEDLIHRLSEAFENAADKVSPSVVPIFAEQVVQVQNPFGMPNDPFRQFFGDEFSPTQIDELGNRSGRYYDLADVSHCPTFFLNSKEKGNPVLR